MPTKLLFLCLLFCAIAASAEKFDYNMAVSDTSGKKTTLAKYRNKGLLLIYYSLKCSHCKGAVATLLKFKNTDRVNILGIVTSSEPDSEFMKDGKKPLYSFYDKFKTFKEKFKIERVPATIAVDTAGNIIYSEQKFFDENYESVAGALIGRLRPETKFAKTMERRFYGEMVCAVCHPGIHAWWEKTGHADAYSKVAKETFGRTGYREGMAVKVDPAQLKYTTVGFGEPAGYDPVRHPKSLLGVQCESCHGPGGPHGSGPTKDYEARCVKCHDSSRDPTFHLADWLKKLNHPKD